MPSAVGGGLFPDRNGGRWRPDAGRLLALLEDGTVFAAIQQARVPGLGGVRAMAECGDGVVFTRTDGQLVQRGWPDPD
jgi:hypothetical protein